MIQKLRTKIRLMDSFNLIQSHQKILMKNTNKPRTKNSARENIDLFVQKIPEARLIDYQDNTDIASKISYQIFFCTNNSRKGSKKMMKKINRLFYHNRHQ